MATPLRKPNREQASDRLVGHAESRSRRQPARSGTSTSLRKWSSGSSRISHPPGPLRRNRMARRALRRARGGACVRHGRARRGIQLTVEHLRDVVLRNANQIVVRGAFFQRLVGHAPSLTPRTLRESRLHSFPEIAAAGSAQLGDEEVEEAEQDCRLTQERHVHLARDAAHAAVHFCSEIADLLRHLDPNRGSKRGQLRREAARRDRSFPRAAPPVGRLRLGAGRARPASWRECPSLQRFRSRWRARSPAPAPAQRWPFPTLREIPPASAFDDRPCAKRTVKRARHCGIMTVIGGCRERKNRRERAFTVQEPREKDRDNASAQACTEHPAWPVCVHMSAAGSSTCATTFGRSST